MDGQFRAIVQWWARPSSEVCVFYLRNLLAASRTRLLFVAVLTLDRCKNCHKAESDHAESDHKFERDARFPEWHGWHAARRGLGSNLYRLGVPDMVIQRILRHANVSTRATYYIKTATDDIGVAMTKLEQNIATPATQENVQDTNGTLTHSGTSVSESVN